MPNAPEQFKGAPHSVPGATGGLTAVTATENTREGVFDAMQRREAYATTGTTSVSSLWAAQTQHYVKGRNLAEIGYGKGVPMGGDHAKAPDGKAATFLLYAMRDPVGANLDRIQVVKGWLDADGSLKERIYDVAVSDGREIGEDGRCRQAVGNTVNIPSASFTNTIGSPVLSAYWKDPDFDPAERAFYYVRALEIPTPRWSTYDAAFFNVALPEKVPPTLQDRAYTSAVWYSPGK